MQQARRWVGRCADKTPINPRTLKGAQSTTPSTWGTLSEAVNCIDKMATYNKGETTAQIVGIGFVLGDGWAGADLDTVFDPDTGELAADAQSIISEMSTYTEVSPSGYGFHCIARVDADTKLPGNRFDLLPNGIHRTDSTGKAKKPELEMYTSGRYFTITGDIYGDKRTAEERTNTMRAIAQRYADKKKKLEPVATTQSYTPVSLSDSELIDKIRKSKNGDLFNRLWSGNIADFGDRSAADMSLCNILAFWTQKDAAQIDRLFRQSGLMRSKWDERHYSDGRTYGQATIATAIRDCTAVFEARKDTMQRREPKGKNQNIKPDDYSDAGNAEIFTELYGNDLVYTNSIGWLYWNGSRWESNDLKAIDLATHYTQKMLSDARAVYHQAKEEAEDCEDKDQKSAIINPAKKYLAHAEKSRSFNRIKAMTEVAKPQLIRQASDFDAEPHIINTPSGIVDLKTGEISPHSPQANCTKITRCAPNNENADIWDDFLDTITCGDGSLRGYLQLVAGMALVGAVYQEGMLIAYGSGANGKSTFFNALGAVMGDYFGAIDIDVLTTKDQNKGAALATLRGKRLVVAGELEEFQRLSPATVKRITSTDPITVEQKYRDPETIQPSHTLCLFTNFMPRVSTTDPGTWRRLFVVPFNAKITGSSDIKNYTQYLVEHCGGAILQWAIDGAVMFCRNGHTIQTPDIVAEVTEEYQQRENWLENFIADCCDVEVNYRVNAGDLIAAYKEWARSVGEYEGRRGNEIYNAMIAAGFEQVKPRNVKTWLGLRLKASASTRYYGGNSFYA